MNAARTIVVLLSFSLAGMATGCGGYYGDDLDLDAGGNPGIESIRSAYESEKYYEAIRLAKQFVRVNPGSRFLDEAQYLMARSEYEEENYLEAEDHFRRLLRDFPSSAYGEDASYYLALAILSQSRKAELDQRETIAAQSQFKSFLLRYPHSEYVPRVERHLADIDLRLAKKDFINGETYRKMKRYQSAVFYYEKVTEKWSDTPYAEKSLYRLAEVAKERKRWSDALAYTRQYLALFPAGEFLEDIQDIREEAQENVDSDSASARGGP